MKMRSKLAAVAAPALALGYTAANAAIDAAVTSGLDAATTDVGTIGKGVFLVALGIVLYKWFKRAL